MCLFGISVLVVHKYLYVFVTFLCKGDRLFWSTSVKVTWFYMKICISLITTTCLGVFSYLEKTAYRFLSLNIDEVTFSTGHLICFGFRIILKVTLKCKYVDTVNILIKTWQLFFFSRLLCCFLILNLILNGRDVRLTRDVGRFWTFYAPACLFESFH